MKRWYIETTSSLLILLFLYTALSKLSGYRRFRWALSRSPLLHELAPALAYLIPIAEISICVLLLVPASKKWGLYGSLALLLAFTTYLVYMILCAPVLPCPCGGVMSRMTWQQHIGFNLLFIVLSGAAIYLQRQMDIQPNLIESKYK